MTTLSDYEAEEWLDEWADELREDAFELCSRESAPPYMALQDDECDECHLDIYEGEPVFNDHRGSLIHAACRDREGNIW